MLNNIKKAGLLDRISLYREDVLDADLSQADVIFDMLPEGENDFEKIYQSNIRNGTHLVKHDLPLIGFIADKIDYPFYRMRFPLTKAINENLWAEHILGKSNARIEDV